MTQAPTFRIASCLAALMSMTQTVLASGPLPVGHFGLASGHADWTIAQTETGYQATFLQDKDSQTVFELTETGRQTLWKRLDWPAETAASAACLGNMLDVFCRVEAPGVSAIAVLKDSGASYFHYDRTGGARAIHPAKR